MIYLVDANALRSLLSLLLLLLTDEGKSENLKPEINIINKNTHL